VADLTATRNALAARITSGTGLRAFGQPRDQVSPPCALVFPADLIIVYGRTFDGAVDLNLFVLLIISDAPPIEKTQRALDAYIGIGAGESSSIPAAIMADPTLGGVVHFCEPVSVSHYGRVEYAGQPYFGARVNVTVGTQ
jgi:hypothetical protein